MLKVFQINLTDDLVNQINAGEIGPAAKAYLHSTLGKVMDAAKLELYEHVADVSTDDNEVAFMIMNRWSEVDEKMVRRHKPLHSMSVGDILIDDDHNAWVCASCGFEQLSDEDRKVFECCITWSEYRSLKVYDEEFQIMQL